MAWQAVAQLGRAVRVLCNTKSQRSFDTSFHTRLQHANSEMRVIDHDDPVTRDGDTDGLRSTGSTRNGDDAHLVRAYGALQRFQVTSESFTCLNNLGA